MEYEINRGIMWIFTTPLMLKMYCDANDIKLLDINVHYHLISIIPHIFLIPFKNHYIYFIFTIICSIPAGLFLKTLYKYNKLPFTNLYILIWSIFILINVLEITRLCNPIFIHAFYNLADTVCKFICNVVISNHNEQETIDRESMDLQSINFIAYMKKGIYQFENNNKKVTPNCDDLIKYCKKKFQNKIPKSNSRLKLELLKKILPFDLDQDYITRAGSSSSSNSNSNSNFNSNSGIKKEFNFISVMFMDIVNYTELANIYKDGDIIIKLLDDIYHHFDDIIKKYSHLQKIETIGDAYVVVGDLYRQELNHKDVVKEIILLGLDFIREIKNIKTPGDIVLSIRLGINIGTVNIGILGNEIPRLSVVGNTVNMAARLQSTASHDSIQMSRHVYEHAQEIDFGIPLEFEEKNNIFLKNIGSVTTYNIVPKN
jgi:class 3 adenylate cyclase